MKLVSIIVCISWLPHSIKRSIEVGSDWDIYYQAGLGNFVRGWVYKDFIHYFFIPFSWFGHDGGFVLLYFANIAAFLFVTLQLRGQIGILIWIASFYPILLALELGNIAPILAALCLSLPGAFLAMLVKPYLIILVFINAIRVHFQLFGDTQTWIIDSTHIQNKSLIYRRDL